MSRDNLRTVFPSNCSQTLPAASCSPRVTDRKKTHTHTHRNIPTQTELKEYLSVSDSQQRQSGDSHTGTAGLWSSSDLLFIPLEITKGCTGYCRTIFRLLISLHSNELTHCHILPACLNGISSGCIIALHVHLLHCTLLSRDLNACVLPCRFQPEGMCTDLRKFIDGPSSYLTLPEELKSAIEAITYIAEALQAEKDYEAVSLPLVQSIFSVLFPFSFLDFISELCFLVSLLPSLYRFFQLLHPFFHLSS